MLLWCLQYANTALIVASEYSRIEIVKHLLEHQADVNARNIVSNAVSDGLFDCSELLWCLQYADTALMLALEKGHIEVVKHLVVHNADVNAKNKVSAALTDGLFDCANVLWCLQFGNTALMLALENNHTEVVKYL